MLGKKGSEDAGEGPQMTAFWIIELGVCVLLLAGFAVVGTRLLADTNEDLLAKDIGLSIETIAAAPADVYYRYAPNTEGYYIKVDAKNTVEVTGEASASYRFDGLPGITIEQRVIGKSLSIPITKTGDTITFTDNSPVQGNNICASLVTSFSQKPSISIQLKPVTSEDSKYLETLRKIVEVMVKSDFDTDTKPSYDITLTLGFSYNDKAEVDRLIIKYAEPDKQYQNNQRLGCSIMGQFQANLAQAFSGFDEVPNNDAPQLSVFIGSLSKLKAQPDFEKTLNDYATQISAGLKEGVRK